VTCAQQARGPDWTPVPRRFHAVLDNKAERLDGDLAAGQRFAEYGDDWCGRLPAEQYMPADGILERLRSGALGTAVGELP
jgi:hypothetical protein